MENYKEEINKIYKINYKSPFGYDVDYNDNNKPIVVNLPEIEKKAFCSIFKILIKEFEQERREYKIKRKETQRNNNGIGYDTDHEIKIRNSLNVLYQLRSFLKKKGI
jgi:hypothetical protein